MADRLKINREQLAKFCPDAETIKQFEKLFARVSDVTDDNASEDMSADIIAIGAKASLALDMVSMLEPSNAVAPEPDILPYAVSEGIPVDSISFNSGRSAPLNDGSLSRNTGPLEVTLPRGVQSEIGMAVSVPVRNDTASAIPRGKIVRVVGATDGVLSVDLFIADGSFNHFLCLGVTSTDIEVGGLGYVATSGVVTGIDTSAWMAGNWLWASEFTLGGLEDYEVWLQAVRVGFVLDSKVDGNILISMCIS